MLVVLNELVGPVGDDVADSVTAPENPLSGAILMVVEPDPPAWIEREVGLAVIVKFGVDDVIAKDVVCERSPLVPVTVTVNVPLALVRHDRVEVPVLVRLEDVRLHVIPADGEADSESDTVPVKLFRKLTVMVEVADAKHARRQVGVLQERLLRRVSIQNHGFPSTKPVLFCLRRILSESETLLRH